MKRQQRGTSLRRTSSGAAALMTMFVFSAAASATVTNASSYGLTTQQVAVGLGLLVILPYAIWAYRDEKRRSKL